MQNAKEKIWFEASWKFHYYQVTALEHHSRRKYESKEKSEKVKTTEQKN